MEGMTGKKGVERVEKIRLSKNFYDKEAILTVRERFREAANIGVEEEEGHYIISLKDADDRRILLEFANHCLAESR